MELKWNREFGDKEALDDYVYKQLRRIEAHTKEKLLNPHNPGGSSGITIGVGYDVKKGHPEVRRGVLKGIGMQTELLDDEDPSKLSASEKIELAYIKKLQNAMAGGESLKALNDILSQRANDKTLKDAMKTGGKSYELRAKLKFENEGEVRVAFGEAVEAYKDNVNLFVGDRTAKDPDFKLSRERAALLVVCWLNPALARSVSKTDNRAEAWHKIRYGWAAGKGENAQFNIGWAKRRYIESEMLGLYNDPDKVSLEEAKQVYRMFQKHKDGIAAHEKLHGPHGSVKTKKWNRTAFEEANYGKKEVKTVAESFAPAKAVLLAAVKEQYKDNPTLVAKLTADINNFRPIDNYLNALKEVEKQPQKAQYDPEPVYAGKEHVNLAKEPLQPEGGLLSKIGEMGQKMHNSEIDAALAHGKLINVVGELVDKIISPPKAGASELTPDHTKGVINNPQTSGNISQNAGQTPEYSIYPASELRKIAFAGLDAIEERKNEMREWYSINSGKPLAESMIEVAAGFSHLTDDEQKTFINNAVLTKERQDLNKETQQRNEIAEAYGYNRFYAKIPNFLKNRHQKDYDQWGRELEQKDSDLSKREMENRPEMEKVLAKVNTPEFQEKKAQTFSEFKTSEAERLKDLAALDKEWDSFAGQKFCINRLIEKLPAKIGNMGIVVKGDPKDIDNLLSQSKQIGAQTEPAIQMARQYERGIERT
jgi:hypothetical protein